MVHWQGAALSTVFAFGGYGRVGAAGPYPQLLFVVVGVLVGT